MFHIATMSRSYCTATTDSTDSESSSDLLLQSTTMSTIPDDFKIVLQKGIEGGFAPPTPHARYDITRTTKSDVFTVSTELRAHGTPNLGPPKKQELKVADHAESIARLQNLLRDLPTQYPGAEDLYGRNISIVHATDAGAFVNFYRSGMAAGFGIPLPTEEQRAQFDEAVTIIEKLGA
ncbi:hypothetical protein V8E55_003175 [Tylopilus felleus]